mmetsp:Transcript_55313/g.177348  ORF Transcript_55313/g.177348 Transcript_55313/m.177348 type:complete len:236 (+) Transcript_55313:106-813(+)
MGAACCTDIDRAGALASVVQTGQPPVATACAPGAATGSLLGGGPVAAAAVINHGGASAPAGSGNGGDQFVSQVGELPKFDKASKGPGDLESTSEASSRRSVDLDGVSDMVSEVASKQQRTQAKAVVKDFVKEMVKGKKMNVMTQTGQLKTCSASLSRSLDTFSIKVGTQKRNIKLKDVEEIHAGAETIDGVNTPLDDLCATLMLASDDCITFRLNDINARDTFVMCLLMFCNHQK